MSNQLPQFIVYADRIGEWRFRFICADGVARLRASEGYNAKVNAYKAIDSVIRNSAEERRFDYKENSRGKQFFTLKARNGNILAVSRNHAELDSLQEDAQIIKEQVGDASIIEEAN